MPTPTPDLTVDAFTRAFLRELNFGQGVELSASSVNDQYLALARTVRQYLMSRWLETQHRQRESQAKSVAYLSAEFLLGRQLDNALLCTGPGGDRRRGAARPGHRPGRPARRGDRAGPGQRRPGPAGRVLHRLAVDDVRAVDRLRHPLRVRHLPPDVRRRAPGREARHVARARFAVGVPAPRGRGDGRLRRPDRAVRRRGRRGARDLDPGVERARRALQLHGPRLPQRPGVHAAAVERPRDARLRPADLQLRRTTPTRCGPRPSPRTSPRCSTPRTPRRRARSCGCSSSTSSWPARCATSSTRCCRTTSTCVDCPSA